VSARFLDGADFQGAIQAVEAVSAAEVVVAVRRRSYEYRNANLVVGMVVAFSGLAAMLFSERPFGLVAILVDPFVVGIAAGLLVELLPGVKRVLTSRARRRHFVDRAARATFVDRGVHATASRAGVLVYISWLEQQVVVVPDVAIARAVPADALAALERDLTAAMPRGGAAVSKRLADFAPELAKALPRVDADVNELPDAIDSDLVQT
jgi:putative membrane protein